MAVVFLYLDPQADNRTGRQHYEFERLATSQRRGYGLQVRYSAESHQFSTGSEIMRIIGGYNIIHRLVIFAHGGPSWIGWSQGEGQPGGGITNTPRRGSWVTVTNFCNLLGPKLASNAIIALAACSAGMSPADYRQNRSWRESNTRNRGTSFDIENLWRIRWASNGIGSIASRIRDGCLQNTATGTQVRAHSNAGHATRNPHIITFSPPAGSPGVYLGMTNRQAPGGGRIFDQNLLTWMNSWASSMAGEQAQEYLLGGSVEGLPPSYSQSISNREVRSSGPVVQPYVTGPQGQEETVPVPQGMNRTDVRLQRDESQLGSKDVIYSSVEEWATDVEEELMHFIY